MDPNQAGRIRRWWTEGEDHILRKEVAAQLKTGVVSDWHRVAAGLPGRSNKDCRKRWGKICNNVKKGAWDAAEDRRLRLAVERHGLCWTEVAQEVHTRHADQCAKRWQNSLDPNIVHSQWEAADDERLMRAVETQGRTWSKIAEEEFPNRSTTDIKNRHALLLRRRHCRRRGVRRQSRDSSSEVNDSEGDSRRDRSASIWDEPSLVEPSVSYPQATQFSHYERPVPLDQPWPQVPMANSLPLHQPVSLKSCSPPVDQVPGLGWDAMAFDPSTAMIASSSPPDDATHCFFGTPPLDTAPDSPLSSSLGVSSAMSNVSPLAGMNIPPLVAENHAAAAQITLVLQDAEPQTLSKVMDILYHEQVRYKLNVWQ